ncbi:STAS domain-containing protein [Hymenobacter weizhouensis]|uniref:hypothetical protein n=1 Tax=Hymenobacter sp. YIM 151500-1 TaxID=2987689 RepID=UPI002225D8CD|nr:hypothetical protein [Hymenobacter sp. YIM 151500-1]UYZ64493.1 hypothetical protein OIS53_06490 [Hymenobacter sp. YIM 151500-1]
MYREVLPNGFLLILSSNGPSAEEIKLTRALHRASRSDKPAILLDFSLVNSLSEEVIELVLAYAFVLHAQGRRLILCHVPEPAQHHFLYLDATSQPLLVPTLFDAMHEIKRQSGNQYFDLPCTPDYD